MKQKYNKFTLSDELANALSTIITQKEGTEYVCKNIKVVIPEYTKSEFSSPFAGLRSPNQVAHLSYEQICNTNEKFGKCATKIVPASEYTFFVVMKEESYHIFSKISFEGGYEEFVDIIVGSYCDVCEEYDGIFDTRILMERFPYLQYFFKILNNWRIETKNIMVDADIINTGVEKTLKNKSKVKKRYYNL